MPASSALAVVSIAWVVEDRIFVGRQLRAKLSVPNEDLIGALRSLAQPELDELKRAVLEAFAKGRLPSGLSRWFRWVALTARTSAVTRRRA